jgi:putative hydrolase of the HAD superfamily
MNIQTPITTLIFDFGGVLINLDLPLCISKLKSIGATDVEKYLSNFGQSGFFLEWEKGKIGLEEFRRQLRAICSNNPSDEAIDTAWMAFLQDIPAEKIELLRKLRSRYRILMLSNTNPLHIRQSARIAFEAHGTTMNQLFDKCYLSYEIGLTKPDKAIFEYLLADAGLEPRECLFIDDGQKNIDTATAMGFATRLVKQDESLGFLLEL